jgi:hypothetical protein
MCCGRHFFGVLLLDEYISDLTFMFACYFS